MGGRISNEECISHGPWGGSKGEDWVYMPEGGFIKKITIVHAGVIDRIRFQSDCHTGKTETSIFGGDGGKKTDLILIDYPDEYLTSISGTIGYIGGSNVVTSVCFRTNQIRYGPYGYESGSPFSYDGKNGVIVGFYGRAGTYIDAIGIYVIPKSLAFYACEDESSHGVHSKLCCKMSALGMASGAGPWGPAGGGPHLLNLATTTASAVNLQIPTIAVKLDRDNFALWRTTIIAALEAFDLEEFILSPNPPPTTIDVPAAAAVPATADSPAIPASPATTAPNPAFAAWKKRDRFVLLWLQSTLSERALSIITLCHSSQLAWQAIEKTYQAFTDLLRLMGWKP